MSEGSVPDMCQMFYSHFPRHESEIILYGDATSERRVSQTGKSDYFVIRNEMKGYGVPVGMRVPEVNPIVPDRVNAVNYAMRNEDGQVRLLLDQSCQELAKDLEGVLRDHKGGILKTHNRKDPYFNRTHSSDALGYWINREAPVRPFSPVHRKAVSISLPGYGFRR